MRRSSSADFGRPSLLPRMRVASNESLEGGRRSNIPVVKKGTSNLAANPTKARQSLLSGVNKSRKFSGSNLFSVGRESFSTAESKKDSRPIFDKNFQEKCKARLFEFLVSNNYPLCDKTLNSPSHKDFLQIFQFMYKFFDESYHLNQQVLHNKPEDEIPLLFKELKYPFTVLRSHITSIGSRGWPVLLAALDYLRTLITVGFKTISEPVTDFSAPLSHQLCFKFTSDLYDGFFRGRDNFDSNFEQLREKEIGSLQQELDKLNDEYRKIEKETEPLKAQHDQIPEFENRITMISEDKEKFQTYLQQFKGHIELKTKETVSLVAELDAETKSLQLLKDEVEKKKELIKVQEINLVMYNEMKEKYTEQIEEINRLQTEIADIRSVIENEEIKISRSKEKVESVINNYNSMCRKMRLIPETEPYANNQDYELKFSFGKDLTSRLDELKYMINNKSKENLEQTRELAKYLIDVEANVARLAELLADCEQDAKKDEEKIASLDKELELFKETEMKKIQDCEKEIQILNDELYKLGKTYDLTTLERQYEEAQINLKAVKEAAAQKKKAYMEVFDRGVKARQELNKMATEKLLKEFRKVRTFNHEFNKALKKE